MRDRVEKMHNDPTTPGTRLADWPLRMTPAQTDALTNLMLGGYFASGRIWMLHSRLRYFDPESRRAGAPEHLGALVEKLEDDGVTVTLVNTDPVNPLSVIVQAGAYAEHQFVAATVDGDTVTIDQPYISVRIEPGCGSRIAFKMKRYANQPSLAFPWQRGTALQ